MPKKKQEEAVSEEFDPTVDGGDLLYEDSEPEEMTPLPDAQAAIGKEGSGIIEVSPLPVEDAKAASLYKRIKGMWEDQKRPRQVEFAGVVYMAKSDNGEVSFSPVAGGLTLYDSFSLTR